MTFMMRRMSLGLVLVLMTALPAAAGFMVSDQIYVPVVAHAEGLNDSQWSSDVYLTNVEPEVAIDVAMVYLPSGLFSNSYVFTSRSYWLGGNEDEGFGIIEEQLTGIPPGGTVVLKDVVGSYWPEMVGSNGLGSLIVFAYETGTLGQEPSEEHPYGRVLRNIVVTSRTFNTGTLIEEDPDNEGEYIEVEATYGQVIPGVPWYNLADAGAVDDEFNYATLIFNGVISTEDFRYNLGLLNASDRLTNLTVRLKPYQADGEPFLDADGLEVGIIVDLPALAHVQYNGILGSLLGIEDQVEVATVEVKIVGFSSLSAEPLPMLTAYGSVVDNDSNDPTTILPSFKHPYDVECMWPSDDAENPAKVLAQSRGRSPLRPHDIPPAIHR